MAGAVRALSTLLPSGDARGRCRRPGFAQCRWRHARGLAQGVAFRQLETPEQVIVQREAEIIRAELQSPDEREPTSAPGKSRSAFPAAASTFRPFARRRSTMASGRVTRDRARAWPPAPELREFRPGCSGVRLPPVAQQPRELAHRLARTLIGDAVDHDDRDAIGRAHPSIRIDGPFEPGSGRARMLGVTVPSRSEEGQRGSCVRSAGFTRPPIAGFTQSPT
jgi:hypothetical protein